MRHFKLLLLSLLLTGFSYAQVGIGTTGPHPSSMLDIQSNSQGLLAPRMTTLERTEITDAAESLLVFDTDEDAFYFFNTTSNSWVALANNTTVKRNNYKLIKSAADLAPELIAGGSSYLLDENTFYEINGTINLAKPIDLNNAYLAGMDANEDVLSYPSGTVFKGSTGGSIRNVTLRGTKAFEITGSPTGSLLVQNTIIEGMAYVGSISGFGMYLGNIIQFLGNANGITYTNIGNLLLNNQGWFNTNNGTFETFTGSFGLIEKVSGFSIVDGADVALDFSSNPLVGTGALQGTVFTGTTTASSGYVKGYTLDSYPGYNFSNAWTINAPGLIEESDAVASANIYYTGSIATGFYQTISNGDPVKMSGTNGPNGTLGVNMLRTSAPGNNRIVYHGKKTRTFQINASLSVRGTNGTDGGQRTYYAFFIRKNGITSLIETKSVMKVLFVDDIASQAINGTVELSTDDFVEIWVQRIAGTPPTNTEIETFSLNLSIR